MLLNERSITLEQCDVLNPATLLPEMLQPEQGSLHNCLEIEFKFWN